MPGKKTSGGRTTPRKKPILNKSKAAKVVRDVPGDIDVEAADRSAKSSLLKGMASGTVPRQRGMDLLKQLDPKLKGKNPGRTQIKYGPGTESLATRFVKDMTYNNPFVGTLGAAAAVPAIARNPKQAAKGVLDQIRHPIRSASQNPFSALSILAGGGLGAAAGTRTALRAADREIYRDFDSRNPYDLNDPKFGRDQRRTIPLNDKGWTLRRTDPRSPQAFGVSYTSDKKLLPPDQPFTAHYNVVDPDLRVHGTMDYSLDDPHTPFNFSGEMFTSKTASKQAPNAAKELVRQAYWGGGAKQLASEFANPKLGRDAHKMGKRVAREINAKHDSVYREPSDYDRIRAEYINRPRGGTMEADPWEASQDLTLLDRLDSFENPQGELFRMLDGTHPDYMHGVIGNAVQHNLIDPLDAEDLMEDLMSGANHSWTPPSTGNRAKWEKDQIKSYVKNPDASYDGSALYGQMDRRQALAKLVRESKAGRAGKRLVKEEKGTISGDGIARDLGVTITALMRFLDSGGHDTESIYLKNRGDRAAMLADLRTLYLQSGYPADELRSWDR